MAKIEVNKQLEDIKKVASLNEGKNLKYCILTMGCQLNENDSEKALWNDGKYELY